MCCVPVVKGSVYHSPAADTNHVGWAMQTLIQIDESLMNHKPKVKILN